MRPKKPDPPPKWYSWRGFTLQKTVVLQEGQFLAVNVPWSGKKVLFVITKHFRNFKRSIVVYADNTRLVARTYFEDGTTKMQYWVKTK